MVSTQTLMLMSPFITTTKSLWTVKIGISAPLKEFHLLTPSTFCTPLVQPANPKELSVTVEAQLLGSITA